MHERRNPYIETLRGIAIIMVVAGHVIGNSETGGMQAVAGSVWRYIYFNIDKIQMPLFALISGWVYALRPPVRGAYTQFVGRKAQRLLIPMLIVGAAHFVLHNINNNQALAGIWKLTILPYNMFWFLYSLFFIFVLVGFLDIWDAMKRWWQVAAAIVFFSLLYRYEHSFIPESFPNILSFKGAIYLLPYFLSGVAVRRFPTLFADKRMETALWCALAACFMMVEWVCFGMELGATEHYMRRSWLGICTGLACTALLYCKFNVYSLIRIGGFTFSIYLYHSFSKGFSQMLLENIGVQSALIIFAGGMTCGIFVPIAIDIALSRTNLTRYLLLGKPMKKKGKAKARPANAAETEEEASLNEV